MRPSPSHSAADRLLAPVQLPPGFLTRRDAPPAKLYGAPRVGDCEPLAVWRGLRTAIPLALGMWVMILLAFWSISGLR